MASLSPVVDATDKTMIGTLSKDPEITLGATSVGSESWTFATTRLSSSSTCAVVTPKSNSTRTTDRFALDVEVTFTKFFRTLDSSSMMEET